MKYLAILLLAFSCSSQKNEIISINLSYCIGGLEDIDLYINNVLITEDSTCFKFSNDSIAVDYYTAVDYSNNDTITIFLEEHIIAINYDFLKDRYQVTVTTEDSLLITTGFADQENYHFF